MRHLWWTVFLAACGGAHPGPAGSAPVTNADAGQLAVAGGDVTLTLTGVSSVSTPMCRDLVSFAIEAGGTWVDVTQSIDAHMYWLDGERFRSGGADPFAPCCRQEPGVADVVLYAPLTGVRRTGDRDGLPEYQTADLRGDVRVTFSYSLDGCATYRTFSGTIHR